MTETQIESGQNEKEGRDRDEARRRLTEVGVGITLLGVIVNMGLTIGLSLSGPLVVRLPLALGVPLAFVVCLAVASRRLHILSGLPWALTQEGPNPWDRLSGDEPE